MASAQSLLGLMTQLQNMEASVASVLMEAALKLSSLIDINLFFLVETSEGRRYAGSPQLTTDFLNGHLLATESDVECSLHPGVSALQEHYPSSSSMAPTLHRRTSQTPRRKRPSIPTNGLSSSPPKMAKVSEATEGGGGTCSNLVSSSDAAVDEEEHPVIDGVIDSDAAAFGEWRATEAGSDRGFGGEDPSSRLGCEINTNRDNWQLTSPLTRDLKTGTEMPQMDFLNDIYPQTLLDKLNALDAFDTERIFDAHAAPRKVLNSILHEVGTKLAFSCSFWPRNLANPQVKEFLISNVEEFILKFPVMTRICNDREKVYIGKKAMSKLTYVKNNIRSSYDKQFKTPALTQ